MSYEKNITRKQLAWEAAGSHSQPHQRRTQAKIVGARAREPVAAPEVHLFVRLFETKANYQ